MKDRLPITMDRKKFQRKRYFFHEKIVGSTLELSAKVLLSLDKYKLKNLVLKLCFCDSTYRK